MMASGLVGDRTAKLAIPPLPPLGTPTLIQSPVPLL